MNAISEYKEQINSRRLMLEAEIATKEKQIEADLQYFISTLPSTIKEEVISDVKNSSPIMAKVMNLLQGKSNKKSSNIDQVARPIVTSNATCSLLQVALPIIYTIGSQKILSYSLRSAGKLIRFGLRQLLGVSKKRKR